MPRRQFSTTILADPDSSWGHILVPFDVREAFGKGGIVRVRLTFAGHEFRTAVFPQRGKQHYLVINREMVAATGVNPGDTAEFLIERDDEPRPVVVPPDLQTALDADPPALAAFEKLPPSHRREYARWIDEAKRRETRDRRIAQTIERLKGG